jgi:hypothetical protein
MYAMIIINDDITKSKNVILQTYIYKVYYIHVYKCDSKLL